MASGIMWNWLNYFGGTTTISNDNWDDSMAGDDMLQ
jgi:hypothetical protein